MLYFYSYDNNIWELYINFALGDIGRQTIQIRYEVPETCQILMFSATYPENVMSYCKGICSEKCAKIVLPDIKRLMIPERRQVRPFHI